METIGKLYQRDSDNENFRELLIGVWNYSCSCGDSHRLTFNEDASMHHIITFPRKKTKSSVLIFGTNELKGYWEVKDMEFVAANAIKIVHMNTKYATAIDREESLNRRLNSDKLLVRKAAIFEDILNTALNFMIPDSDSEETFGITEVINLNEIKIYISQGHEGSMKRILYK